MSAPELVALAARVEAAGGGDRELDCRVAAAAGGFFELPPKWEGGPIGYGYLDADGGEVRPGHGGDQLVPRYTRSLDAAMTLVPVGWRVGSLGETVIEGDDPWNVRLLEKRFDGRAKRAEANAAAPALALTAACLKARAQQQEREDHAR